MFQCVPNLRAAVQPPGIQENSTDPFFKLLTAFAAIAFLAFRPFVVTAFGNAEHGAHLRDTELQAVSVDERINQRRSFAK